MSYDRLHELFDDQKRFTKEIYTKFKEQPFYCYNFDKEHFDIYYSLVCAVDEVIEAKRLVDSKIWSIKRNEIPKKILLEELVDASKFIMQTIQMLGYNSNDFYNMFMEKSEINRKRQREGY